MKKSRNSTIALRREISDLVSCYTYDDASLSSYDSSYCSFRRRQNDRQRTRKTHPAKAKKEHSSSGCHEDKNQSRSWEDDLIETLMTVFSSEGWNKLGDALAQEDAAKMIRDLLMTKMQQFRDQVEETRNYVSSRGARAAAAHGKDGKSNHEEGRFPKMYHEQRQRQEYSELSKGYPIPKPIVNEEYDEVERTTFIRHVLTPEATSSEEDVTITKKTNSLFGKTFFKKGRKKNCTSPSSIADV